jgi:hypothetical protein
MKTIPFSSKICHHIARFCICLIIVASIAGMCSCNEPSPTIQIWDWDDLYAIKNNLNGNHFLMRNLDSTVAGYKELASATANGGEGWQPIGTINAPFTGTFDGQGFEIRDLFINRPNESFVGLFSAVGESGVVQNVGVVNADVIGSDDAGSLVGVNHGTVRNSYSSGSVTGNDLVGGLAGGSTNSLSNSHSTGSVSGQSRVGGLVGGINGIVSESYSSASASGDNQIGGLIGYANGNVRNCQSTGSVTGDSYVGGLVGWNRDIVMNCYSLSRVTGGWLVGGLVGNNRGALSNSYSTGNVSGNEDVGGLVGWNYQGTVSNSFWDIQTSGQTTSAGGIGKTTAEIKSITTFTTWDIAAVTPGQTNPSYIWNIVNDQTYPFLSWQS